MEQCIYQEAAYARDNNNFTGMAHAGHRKACSGLIKHLLWPGRFHALINVWSGYGGKGSAYGSALFHRSFTGADNTDLVPGAAIDSKVSALHCALGITTTSAEHLPESDFTTWQTRGNLSRFLCSDSQSITSQKSARVISGQKPL